MLVALDRTAELTFTLWQEVNIVIKHQRVD